MAKGQWRRTTLELLQGTLDLMADMRTRLRAIVSCLTFMLARRRLDEDLRLEIDVHLDSLTERSRQQGMSPDEAYIAARRQFGNPALAPIALPGGGPQAKKTGLTAAAAAKAWRVPARYVGYQAEPGRILGAMEWIYRQLP
jgi:hypothetical protein